MTDEPEIRITHLQRRRIEGRVPIPFIAACAERFGEAATRELVMLVVERISAADGANWAAIYGGGMSGLKRVAEELWAGGGGMEIEQIGEAEDHLDFNVTRCGYAEFYKELGLAEIGYLLQCSRDHAIIDGFAPEFELQRTGTIMEGAPCCDFRYRRKSRG